MQLPAAAFEALYRRHESRVFRFLRRNVRNEASANDLMQEVWFAVARGAAGYQPTAKFTTGLQRNCFSPIGIAMMNLKRLRSRSEVEISRRNISKTQRRQEAT